MYIYPSIYVYINKPQIYLLSSTEENDKNLLGLL